MVKVEKTNEWVMPERRRRSPEKLQASIDKVSNSSEDNFLIKKCLVNDYPYVTFILNSEVPLSGLVSKISGIEDMNKECLENIEILGGGSMLHIPNTDIYVGSDGVIRSIISNINDSLLNNIIAVNLGKRTSAKKVNASRRNGLNGGRPKKHIAKV